MTGTEGNEMGVNDMSDTRNRGLTEANGRILMFAVSMSPLVSLVCLTLTSHSSYSRSPSAPFVRSEEGKTRGTSDEPDKRRYERE